MRASSPVQVVMGRLSKTEESVRGESLEGKDMGRGNKRKWFASNEDAAKKMLKYLQDSEDVKVCLRELEEQLEYPEEAGISFMQIAKQSRNERGPKIFQIFGQEENEVYIASLARWDTHLKGLVELERRCQELTQEVKLSSETQEVVSGLWRTKSEYIVMRPKIL